MKKNLTLSKLGEWINNSAYAIGSIGILLTVSCTAFNILSVWFTGKRYSQMDEISLLALVWVVYIGMGLLYTNNQHVSMDFVVGLLPPKGKIISRIINNIIIIAVASITAYYAWNLSFRSFNKLLMITKIPYFYCDIVVFLGYLHLVILAAIDTAQRIAELFNRTGGEESV